MKSIIRVTAMAALALLLSACHGHTQPIESTGALSDGMFVGTLCFGADHNSFDCEASKIASHLAVADHTADVALREGRISAAEAKQRRDEVHRAKALLERADDACRVNSKTGDCSQQADKAQQLLTEAESAASALP